MLDRFLPKTDQIPLVALPIAFKNRVTQLAYIPDLKYLRKTCPEIRFLCRYRARELDQFYFTDDDTHYENSKYYRWFFRRFKYIYNWLGSGNYIYPTWQHFGNLKYAEKYNVKMYVTDTLVLYCATSDSCDKFIPRICGPYTKISIRGHVRWDQVKKLIHSNVKEVQILAQIEFNENEYDDFAKFIKDHLHGGYKNKFMFKFYNSYPDTLQAKVQNVVKRSFTKWLEIDGADYDFFDCAFLYLQLFVYLTTFLVCFSCHYSFSELYLTGQISRIFNSLSFLVILALVLTCCGCLNIVKGSFET